MFARVVPRFIPPRRCAKMPKIAAIDFSKLRAGSRFRFLLNPKLHCASLRFAAIMLSSWTVGIFGFRFVRINAIGPAMSAAEFEELAGPPRVCAICLPWDIVGLLIRACVIALRLLFRHREEP
jgi:hypothetical protein